MIQALQYREKILINDLLGKDILDGLVKTFTGVIILMNKDSKIKRWNRNLGSITGYTTYELMKMFIIDLLPFDERKHLLEPI